MPQLPETRLVNKIRKAILKEYPTAYILKIHGDPYQESGINDLLVCVEGMFFSFEVKDRKPGESEQHARNRTTQQQQSHIDRVNRAEGRAATILGEEEALVIIQTALMFPHSRIDNSSRRMVE